MTIPTIKQIYDGAISNFETEFGITTNPFGQAVLVAFAGVMSGMIYLVYLTASLNDKNIWFDTCDNETLIRYGTTILGRYPFPATSAQYTITVTGTIGAVIPASTVFRSDDNSASPGKLYQVTGATTLAATSENIVVNALEGGTGSILSISDTMTSTSPIINVNSQAIVVTENITPENAENLELYRAKIGDKVRLSPGSWNAKDYRLVGGTVTGVAQVYAYGMSATEVDVWIQGTTPVADPGPSASPTVITAYETALNLVRPLPAFIVNVASCPIKNVDVFVSRGTFPALTVAQQTLVTTALRNFINSVRPFIAAADSTLTRNDSIFTFNLSAVISAAIPGVGYSGVTFEVDGTLVTTWQADNGEIPFFNSVTFTA